MPVSMECLLQRKLSAVLFLLLMFLAFFPTRARADNLLQDDEIQSLVSMLRVSGYHLFANALLMANVQAPLLASRGSSYTVFAPPDAALYDLDLACKSSQEYMDAVKHHIVRTKLSYHNLKALPNAARLDTFLQNQSLTITTFGGGEDENEPVMVNNVTVSFPDLYYDYHVTAHGLETVLIPTAVDGSSTTAFSKAAEAPLSASPGPVREEKLRDLPGEWNSIPFLSYPLQTRPITPEEIEETLEETAGQHDQVAANSSNIPEAIGSMQGVMSSTTSTSPLSQMENVQTVSVVGHHSSSEYSRHSRHPHHLRQHHGKQSHSHSHSHSHSPHHFQESLHAKKSSVDAHDNDTTSNHAAASNA